MNLLRLMPIICFAAAAVHAGELRYSFPVLGDMHYDRLELHDKEFVDRKYARDWSQIKNYSQATAGFMPGLIKAAAAKVDDRTPFAIQLGDFTEGLCGSRELQTRMFEEAIAQVKKEFKVPFLITKGNHDVTGPGAADAYNAVILPYLAGELKTPVGAANFLVRHDGDSFIFFDSMKPDLEFLEKTLAQEAGTRHIFLVTHYPVLPFERRADWILYGKESQNAERRKLLRLLQRYQVIVLCGHLHQAASLTYRDENGVFYQLAQNSVVRSADPAFRNLIDGARFYTPELAEPARTPDPAQLARREAIFAEAAPGIKQFFRADSEGYLLIKVYPDQVDAEFYNGTKQTPDRIVEIRK